MNFILPMLILGYVGIASAADFSAEMDCLRDLNSIPMHQTNPKSLVSSAKGQQVLVAQRDEDIYERKMNFSVFSRNMVYKCEFPKTARLDVPKMYYLKLGALGGELPVAITGYETGDIEFAKVSEYGRIGFPSETITCGEDLNNDSEITSPLRRAINKRLNSFKDSNSFYNFVMNGIEQNKIDKSKEIRASRLSSEKKFEQLWSNSMRAGNSEDDFRKILLPMAIKCGPFLSSETISSMPRHLQLIFGLAEIGQRVQLTSAGQK